MLGRLLFLVAALLLPMAAQAAQLLDVAFPSAALGRDYKLQVYLPDGYDAGTARYPTLYLLHGANGDEKEWVQKGDALTSLNKLITTGDIPPMVVVMPGHTQAWWSDGNKELGETALLKEVVPFVERTYRVIAAKRGRLVAGNSAGGFATINMVLKYPDLFAAAAALSPAIYAPLPPETSSARKNHPFLVDGKFDPASWQRLNWPAWFEGYKAQSTRVPLYINSGDQDRFDIAYHAAVVYQKFREIQPKITSFRVVGGDHEWPVWAETFPDAARFLARFVARPEAVETASRP